MSLDYRIEFTTEPSESDLLRIRTGLSAFNRTKIPDKKHVPLCFSLFDSEGQFAGGLSAYTSYEWLFLDSLWIADSARGHGQGRSLVTAAEKEARERGCANSWLDTFGFQARGFYERLGYQVFGELEDFPPGYSRYFMRKALI